MVSTTIFRPQSDVEKQDFTELGSTDIYNLFLKEMTKVMTKYHRKYKPYDEYSAKVDFNINLKRYEQELQNLVDNDNRPKIDFGDLHQYADTSRFLFIKRIEVKEDKLLDGIRQPTVIGYRYYFKSKIRGNKYSILVPCSNNDKTLVEQMDKWVDSNIEKMKSDEDDDDEDETSKETSENKVSKTTKKKTNTGKE